MFSGVRLRVPHSTAFALKCGVLLGLGLTPMTAVAAWPEYRVTTAGGPFADTHQVAVAFDLSHPRRLGIHHLEINVAALLSEPGLTPLVSMGPVWRYQFGGTRLFAVASVSPTLIGGERFRGEKLGGHVHFTSAVSIGWEFESGSSIAFRLQHTSNAGLRRTNPGLDMIGLSFQLRRP